MYSAIAVVWSPIGNVILSLSLAIIYTLIVGSPKAEGTLYVQYIVPVLVSTVAYLPRRYFQISLMLTFVVLSLEKLKHDFDKSQQY